MQDAVAAMITHYLATSAITDVVSTRIFGGRLPGTEIENMPRKCVVVRAAGGLESFRTHRLQKPRIITVCYGEDPQEAASVDAVIAEEMLSIRRLDVNNTFIHSAGLAGGPIPSMDPDTGWDYLTRVYILRAGDCSTA